MIRFAALAVCAIGCSRSQSTQDPDLPGLVVEAHGPESAVDVERAASDAAELGRVLERPYRAMLAALGPHSVAISTVTTVTEGGKPVSELSDHSQIDIGESGRHHARSPRPAAATRPRRPRTRRCRGRGRGAPDDPEALREQYFDAVAAMWD